MNSFLYRIASIYYQHHQDKLNTFTFVFPNRRAGLFFQKYLSEVTEKPLFSPEIITIESCFLQASNLELADKLNSLFKLYKIYKTVGKSNESFDTFAFWGEMLLADFNEVDKHRVNARQLFTNISELKEIDTFFEVFTENQVLAIQQFWKDFEPSRRNKSRNQFVATWNALFPVYEQFKRELLSEGLGYEGMIAKWVTDKLLNNEDISWFKDKQFVFIGFNALNPCEKVLMTELQKKEQADFYWDYEAPELRDNNNPASLFFKENTRQFKSKYEIKPQIESFNDKQIELIEIPSSVGQTKEIYHILDSLYPENKENSFLETAVVIPDENLLLPLLYAIPEHINKINVTMGYPMQFTPVAGLMEHIFELHKRKKIIDGEVKFYHRTVSNVLNHQFIIMVCGDIINNINSHIRQQNLIYVPAEVLHQHELLQAIFQPEVGNDTLLNYLLNILKLLYGSWQKIKEKSVDYQLESGFLYQYYITVNRLSGILKTYEPAIGMQLDTLISLVKQLTTGITIPFVGEPLDGLQVMGALETRGLEFENVIISSFNEGIYPKKSFSDSFIPYNLRKGFGLPTYEHQDAITSYNFYRLIHRAKRIFLLFDSRIDDGNTGEVSRFYHQLKYLYQLNIVEKKVTYDISIRADDDIQIEKDASIIGKLNSFLDASQSDTALNASSINTYIKCPLKFYFSHIEKIQPMDELSEKLEADVFGSIFHRVIARLYQPFVNQTIHSEMLESILRDEDTIKSHISEAFAYLSFKLPAGSIIELRGNDLLIAEVIFKYIKGVLKSDKKHTPFTYISGEEEYKSRLQTRYGNVNLKGYIDRVDAKDGAARIIDYKTGGGSLEFKDWSDLFIHELESKKQVPHVLQILLYGYLYKQKTQSKQIMPAIIYTKHIFNQDFSPLIVYKPEKEPNVIDNYFDVEENFLTGLTSCVEEIFDPEIPFKQTQLHDNCKYCDFKNICNR